MNMKAATMCARRLGALAGTGYLCPEESKTSGGAEEEKGEEFSREGFMALNEPISPVSDEAPVDKYDLIYLDSGCNSTCHGEVWMDQFQRHHGEEFGWSSTASKSFKGIGGYTRTKGIRELYLGLKTVDGVFVTGTLKSTELANSEAPLLLSVTAQEQLGLITDSMLGRATA